MKHKLMQAVEDKQLEEVRTYKVADEKAEGGFRVVTRDVPDFQIGDTVEVHQRILEGAKERIQKFEGVVIARSGSGAQEMFTVRRIVQGEGVERAFPVYSPRVAKIEVKRTGHVRRAKLYYLRDRVGKATRLRERKGKDGGIIVPGQAEKKGGKKKKGEAEATA